MNEKAAVVTSSPLERWQRLRHRVEASFWLRFLAHFGTFLLVAWALLEMYADPSYPVVDFIYQEF